MKKKLKEYEVCLPITGFIWTTVEAESEEDAIEKALDESHKTDDIEQWDVHRQVVRGNVFYGELNEAYAECHDDDGEEEE